MKKYIIIGITHNGTKLYIKDQSEYDFIWVKDHKRATKYHDYDLALLDWNYIIKYHSQAMKRIFIPIYDETIPPWNEIK